MILNSPKISVVTPVLNAAATLERAIDSILSQNYSPIEYIVVDGGSTDGTLDLLSKYSSDISQLITDTDKNVAEALNKGFSLATGDIYCYLNADDEFMPGVFEKVATIFSQESTVDVVTGGCLRVYADGSRQQTCPPGDLSKIMPLKNPIEQPSTFWRGALHRSIGKFDESFFLAFDWEWWNRLSINSARFLSVPDVFSVYHFSESNLTSNGGKRTVDEMYRVTKQYGPFHGFVADVYLFLYYFFDLRGYYDLPWRPLPLHRRLLFSGVLAILSVFFGHEVIRSYNWNWASKQVRGKVWYTRIESI